MRRIAVIKSPGCFRHFTYRSVSRKTCQFTAKALPQNTRAMHATARAYPSTGFEVLPVNRRFEEETLPGYKADHYYPVRIGDVFQERYQVVAKLGFGGGSTVWLCRELKYVTSSDTYCNEPMGHTF